MNPTRDHAPTSVCSAVSRALFGAGSLRSLMRSTHFTLVKHSPPSSTRRAGAPCSTGSGAPFSSSARSPRRASVIGSGRLKSPDEICAHPASTSGSASASKLGSATTAPAQARHRPSLEATEVVNELLLLQSARRSSSDSESGRANQAVDSDAVCREVNGRPRVHRQRVEDSFGCHRCWLLFNGGAFSGDAMGRGSRVPPYPSSRARAIQVRAAIVDGRPIVVSASMTA